MPQDVAASLAGEVEVAVVRQVDRRSLVGRRPVIDDQLVACRERIRHGDVQRPRISFFAVCAHVGERHADIAAAIDRLAFPHHFVEASAAAVQMILPVVRGELVGRAVEAEPRVADAVRITACHRTEKARSRQIVFEVVEAEDDVVEAAAAIGRLQRHDHGAVRHDARFHAVDVGERVDIDGGAVGHLAERRARYGGGHRDEENEGGRHVTAAGDRCSSCGAW